LYDFIHPNASATATVRSLLIIDPAKKVRLIITYPASTGRNFNEILRYWIPYSWWIASGSYSCQLEIRRRCHCSPSISTEDARKYFRKE
jgi:hypothetical protein